MLTVVFQSNNNPALSPGGTCVPVKDFPAGNKSTSASRRAFLGSLCNLSNFTHLVGMVRNLVCFLQIWIFASHDSFNSRSLQLFQRNIPHGHRGKVAQASSQKTFIQKIHLNIRWSW
jgi:hypothetical protein